MTKINFQDLPNTTTPLNASNMNTLQTNVENAIKTSISSGGSEVGTNEYVDSKQVYRKRVSLGDFPNNANKTVYHNITFNKLIRMTIMGTNGSGTYQDMSLRGPFECYVTASALVFNPGGNYSSWTGYADLYYTKS